MAPPAHAGTSEGWLTSPLFTYVLVHIRYGPSFVPAHTEDATCTGGEASAQLR